MFFYGCASRPFCLFVMDPGEMIKIKRIKGDMKGLGAVTMPDRNVIGCVRKAIPLDGRIQKQTHFDTFFEKKEPRSRGSSDVFVR